MARQKKMICHDCGTLFNRKPQNGHNQVCWSCQSTRVTLVTDAAPPPAIPQAPNPSGLKLPKAQPFTGGAITPQMLVNQKKLLKKVVVQLPGDAASPIPHGVRMLAYQVRNPVITGSGLALELIWRPRGSKTDSYAYLPLPSIDLKPQLGSIALGRMNPDHSNFNSTYRNRSAFLPTRKGPRAVNVLEGIDYFEYGWKRAVAANAKWYSVLNGVKKMNTDLENKTINDYVRTRYQGKIFCERLIFAETGEIFYTPDHYGSFFRYHPGVRNWYSYRSAGGASGPLWDESFYEDRVDNSVPVKP